MQFIKLKYSNHLFLNSLNIRFRFILIIFCTTGDYDWKNGKVSGSVYYFDPELVELVAEVFAKTAYSNPLHPDIFRGVCKMEAEVVRLVANLFHGDENVCGTVSKTLVYLLLLLEWESSLRL